MGTILFYRTNKHRNARTPSRKQTNKGKPNPTCTCLLQGIQVVIIPNIIRDLNNPPGRRNRPGLFNLGLLSRGTLTRVLIPTPPLGIPSHPGCDRLLGKTICPKVPMLPALLAIFILEALVQDVLGDPLQVNLGIFPFLLFPRAAFLLLAPFALALALTLFLALALTIAISTSLRPLQQQQVVQAVPDLVFHGAAFVARNPHQAGNFVDEIVDAGRVAEFVPLPDRLLTGDPLAKGSPERGFEQIPRSKSGIQVDRAVYSDRIPLADLKMVSPVPLVSPVLHHLPGVTDLPDVVVVPVRLHLKLVLQLQEEPLKVLRIPLKGFWILHLAVPRDRRLQLGHKAPKELSGVAHGIVLSPPPNAGTPPSGAGILVRLGVRLRVIGIIRIPSTIFCWATTASTT